MNFNFIAFKASGLDGVKYHSLVGEKNGDSYAPFNLEDRELVNCGVCGQRASLIVSRKDLKLTTLWMAHRFQERVSDD